MRRERDPYRKNWFSRLSDWAEMNRGHWAPRLWLVIAGLFVVGMIYAYLKENHGLGPPEWPTVGGEPVDR